MHKILHNRYKQAIIPISYVCHLYSDRLLLDKFDFDKVGGSHKSKSVLLSWYDHDPKFGLSIENFEKQMIGLLYLIRRLPWEPVTEGVPKMGLVSAATKFVQDRGCCGFGIPTMTRRSR